MLYKAFNARWLTPEDVARKFVPIPQFSALLGPSNCVLAGPRGCGKTTLLKMLTRRAQSIWESERAKNYPIGQIFAPSFEAIYIPSDVRWSYELRAIPRDLGHVHLGELCQRILIGANALRCTLELFDRRLHSVDRLASVSPDLSVKLIKNFGFEGSIATLADCISCLRGIASDLRGLINLRNLGRLQSLVESLSPRIYSDAVDPVISACRIYNETVDPEFRVQKWGICFDEVEIAPDWFGRELFLALRSLAEQEVLLKFTWSPILPPDDEARAQQINDYDPVKLWSAHVLDPKEFCETLSSDFLKAKFPTRTYGATEFLGSSIFASEGADEEPKSIYQKNSVLHHSMIELAQKDEAFSKFVKDKEIDLAEGFVIRNGDGSAMDKVFRKIKPIVLMRNEFMKGPERRTRKRVTLYAGKEAVFAMSEGNPRRLLGLLNQLYDIFEYRTKWSADLKRPVSDLDQAKVLSRASNGALTSLKSTPVFPEEPDRPVRFSLFELVDCIAKYFSDKFYEGGFHIDPVGSFRIDDGLHPDIVFALKRLIDIGAIIPVSEVPGELPSTLLGERFRLSFVIAPKYKLAFRNYSDVVLSTIIAGGELHGQMQFKF